MNSPCDYVIDKMDIRPKPLTKEIFLSLINGSDTRMYTELVRRHDKDSEKYKGMLPAVTWQAKFDGLNRTDKYAIPTGLFCLDVDINHEMEFAEREKAEGREAALKWAKEEAWERAERWARMQKEEDSGIKVQGLNILGIHVSPSETGVHVISAFPEYVYDISTAQEKLAKALQTSYDTVCKNWGRIFFISPKSDWTYLDMDSLFME